MPMMELLKCRTALLSEILAHYAMLDKFFNNHNYPNANYIHVNPAYSNMMNNTQVYISL